MAFDLGDPVPLTVDITDATGNPANAGAVVLTITLPDDTPIAPAVSNPSTGRYQVDYPTTQAGRHRVRWVATGANASAFTDQFDVRPADPGYVISLSDAKAQTNIDSTASDEELRPFIEATTAVIERHTGQTITRQSVTEYHRVHWKDALFTNHRPILSLESIATTDGSQSWTVGDLIVDQATGMIRVVGGSLFHGDLLLGYTAGMAVIPANYTMAARIIVQHLWQTQQQAGLGPPTPWDTGQPTPVVGIASAIPPRALELLGPPPPMCA